MACPTAAKYFHNAFQVFTAPRPASDPACASSSNEGALLTSVELVDERSSEYSSDGRSFLSFVHMTYASFLLRFVGTVGANLSYQVEKLKDAKLGLCLFCCGQNGSFFVALRGLPWGPHLWPKETLQRLHVHHAGKSNVQQAWR